jgi:hypothetical protein
MGRCSLPDVQLLAQRLPSQELRLSFLPPPVHVKNADSCNAIVWTMVASSTKIATSAGEDTEERGKVVSQLRAGITHRLLRKDGSSPKTTFLGDVRIFQDTTAEAELYNMGRLQQCHTAV